MTQAIAAPGVRQKLRGEALYARDLLDRLLVDRGAVLAGVVRSPHAHARIVRVETGPALAVPGVLGVLTGADFADIRLGGEIADERVLADDRVRYVGDHVAALAAETPEALRAGLAAIEVAYEPLPAALDVEAAATGTPIHDECPDNVAYAVEAKRGDWDAVAGNVDVWAEGRFVISPVHHAYMEPYAMLARYEPGQVTLYAATHTPSKIKEEYEPWAARGDEHFELVTPAFGGAFGAKYEHPLHLICAEFARRLHHDVGIALSRREDFLAARPRMDMTLRVRIGAGRDGHLLCKTAQVDANNGAFSGHGPSILMAAMTRMDNLYRYEAIRDSGRLIYTNTVPTECYRGFGDPEASFAQEQLLDELARRLDIDPFELRNRNAVADGETTVHGWRITSSGFESCVELVRAAIAADRAAKVDGDGRHVIGYGFSPGMHVTSNRGRAAKDFAAVVAQVAADGRITLLSSEVDVGTGTERLLASLAARVLDVEPEHIEVVLGDTERGPEGLGSYASRTAFFAGSACLLAARALKERAARLVAEMGMTSAPLPRLAAELDRLGRLSELRVEGEFATEDVEMPDDSGYGNRSPAYTFAAHGCKVEVDTWTGRVRVLRYWAAHDAGTVLDPVGAEGQVVGGVLQGLGHALSEESIRGRDGRMMNPGFLDYRIPTAMDSVPVDVLFTDTFDTGGPLGAKSLAEPPIIPVAACVANAIHDATGARLRRLPMTPEAVLDAITAVARQRL